MTLRPPLMALLMVASTMVDLIPLITLKKPHSVSLSMANSYQLFLLVDLKTIPYCCVKGLPATCLACTVMLVSPTRVGIWGKADNVILDVIGVVLKETMASVV